MYGNSPLCSTGHQPFGAAALLSLHFLTPSRALGTADHVLSLDDYFLSLTSVLVFSVRLSVFLSLYLPFSLVIPLMRLSLLGSGPEGVDDLCFQTYGEFSPPPSSPSGPPSPNPSLEAQIPASSPYDISQP